MQGRGLGVLQGRTWEARLLLLLSLPTHGGSGHCSESNVAAKPPHPLHASLPPLFFFNCLPPGQAGQWLSPRH